MNPAGKDRNRQLVTVGIGTVLTLVMGAVLIAGFRLATQMRANITALQSASVLQTYPATMTQQFNALRDRLESRAYAGQALADLKATVQRFNGELGKLSSGGYVQSSELEQALLLWHQYEPVVNPVVQFTGQPYVESDDAGSSFSKEGRTYYADVKRAQLFANDNQKGTAGSASCRSYPAADVCIQWSRPAARAAVGRCARGPGFWPPPPLTSRSPGRATSARPRRRRNRPATF